MVAFTAHKRRRGSVRLLASARAIAGWTSVIFISQGMVTCRTLLLHEQQDDRSGPGHDTCMAVPMHDEQCMHTSILRAAVRRRGHQSIAIETIATRPSSFLHLLHALAYTVRRHNMNSMNEGRSS